MSKTILIGCGKTKRAERTVAKDLYTGSLFRARRNYAEKSGCEWRIISAARGVLHPDELIEPYDTKMSDLSFLDRVAWPLAVTSNLIDYMEDWAVTDARGLREVVIEIHAGADYAERLKDVIIAAGMQAIWPMKGLSQGEQMKWYADRAGMETYYAERSA